jgi:DNA-binding NarL/FixJ family response regulator
MTSVRVLVADDQKVVRDGLYLMLGLLGIEVLGAVAGGTDAVRQAVAAVPDVVLADLHMPNCDGGQATRLIMRQPPHVLVVVLTGFSDDDSVFAAAPGGSARLPHQGRRRRRGPPGDAAVRAEKPSWTRRCSAG